MNPLRSKRFTYFILLLNALVWSVVLDIQLMIISRGALATILIGDPRTLISRAADEGALAAMFIFGPLFLIVWMVSIVSYFLLERLLKLKKFTLLSLPLIVFVFPVVWTTSTYFYGSLKQLGMRKPPVQTNQQETLKLDATYRNDQYGFEFRYPASWSLNQPDYQGASSISLHSPDYETETLFELGTKIEKGALIIVAFVETDEYSSEWSLKARMERVRREREPRLKEILIDGKTAIFTQYLTSATVNLGIPIETQNNFLFFDISLLTENDEEETVGFLSVFEKIVSTFKFIPLPYFGDTQRTTDINMLRMALEQYRADRGTYPNTLQNLIPSYVVTLPLDPATQAQYLYLVSVTKLDYSLSAQLDDGTILTREAPK